MNEAAGNGSRRIRLIDDDAQMRYNTIARVDTIFESSTVELGRATADEHHRAGTNVRQQGAHKASGG